MESIDVRTSPAIMAPTKCYRPLDEKPPGHVAILQACRLVHHEVTPLLYENTIISCSFRPDILCDVRAWPYAYPPHCLQFVQHLEIMMRLDQAVSSDRVKDITVYLIEEAMNLKHLRLTYDLSDGSLTTPDYEAWIKIPKCSSRIVASIAACRSLQEVCVAARRNDNFPEEPFLEHPLTPLICAIAQSKDWSFDIKSDQKWTGRDFLFGILWTWELCPSTEAQEASRLSSMNKLWSECLDSVVDYDGYYYIFL